jgi:hypothetical protein
MLRHVFMSFLFFVDVLISVFLLVLAYFPKLKVGLSNHQSVCVSPTNNF